MRIKKKQCTHMVWHARAWTGERYVMEPIRQCKRGAAVPIEDPKWCHKHRPSVVARQKNEKLQSMIAELAYMSLPPGLLGALRSFKFE